MKYCINKECEDILGNPDYYFCPWCGTKQTSGAQVSCQHSSMVERPAVNREAEGSSPSADSTYVSSNGKTPDSKPENGGSIPPACASNRAVSNYVKSSYMDPTTQHNAIMRGVLYGREKK